MSKIKKQRHCEVGSSAPLTARKAAETERSRSLHQRRHCGLDPQSPEKRHRHSEQSEESVANFRGLPRSSYLTARNDGAGVFAGDSCFRRNDGNLGKTVQRNSPPLEGLGEVKIVAQTKIK